MKHITEFLDEVLLFVMCDPRCFILLALFAFLGWLAFGMGDLLGRSEYDWGKVGLLPWMGGWFK